MSQPYHRRRQSGHRRHPLWAAALIHRISGLALVIFLPMHFLVLGLAIEGEARLDGFLSWAERPQVRLAEGLLLALVVVHILGGVRVLVLEHVGWHPGQTLWALIAIAVAAFAGGFYLYLL